jgi:hypothetical protein
MRTFLRESISSALDGHSTRMLTNAEIDDISTTDDYKDQLGKIKQLIGERGNPVIEFTSSGASILADEASTKSL